jgi:HEAT repeat protein
MTEKKDFTEVLATLADEGQPFDAPTVYGLSGLSRSELNTLEQQWPGLPVVRRRKLIQHLNLVSEANFEMDFRGINHLALRDSDSDVRQHAIEGLWEDETPALLHKLVAIAEKDPSVEVRAAAIVEIGRFILLGEYDELDEQGARLAQDTVLGIFNANEDDELRRRSLEAIANCGREGIGQMIEQVYAHDDLKMRMSAIFAMGRTCDPVWAPTILQELTSSSAELRYEAARAAGHLELKEAVPMLARLLDEAEDREVLDIGIWALGEIGGEEARKLLNSIVAHAEEQDDEEILYAAQDALDAASLPGEFLLFDFEP